MWKPLPQYDVLHAGAAGTSRDANLWLTCLSIAGVFCRGFAGKSVDS